LLRGVDFQALTFPVDGNRIEKLMLEEPDIMVLDLKKDEDAFLIVGCDGVWEVSFFEGERDDSSFPVLTLVTFLSPKDSFSQRFCAICSKPIDQRGDRREENSTRTH